MISGAANDDPSCIVTYSIAGASFGFATLWTSVLALPLVAAVQLLCSRLGMISGQGLAGAARLRYRRAMIPLCVLLVVANIVTIGADLGGMADVTHMVTGISALIWTAFYGVAIIALLLFFSYRRIQTVFKWLTLLLFAYVAAGVLSAPDWRAVFLAILWPRAEWSARFLSIIVAIVGATVSPYFLFWQASQEVEEEYCLGRRTVAQRKGASRDELERSRVDVLAGALVSKLITYFITLTTAATLFANGTRSIASAEDAARALEPVAGAGAAILFALGVIGTGALAVPVLAGSAAYAISEAMRWRASLDEKPHIVPRFYGLLVVALCLGMLLIYLGLNVVQLLFWASVLNGLLAPVCMFLVVLLTSDGELMGLRVVSGWPKALGWISFLLSGSTALVLLATFLAG